MHEALIDMRRVEKVVDDIQNNDDPRLEVKRTEIRSIYDRMRCSAKGETDLPHASLSSQELAERSLDVVRDVLTFVTRAVSFYDALTSYRPLTEAEKHIGNDLRELLNQLQAIVPKRGQEE